MTWKVTFYSKAVKDETLAFPSGILANYLHILDIVEEFGPMVGKPYTSPMGKGLFEIRAKGKEGIGRSIFCHLKNHELLILHSFIKKTQKTPNKNLKIALQRMREIKNG
jgi:phage-related protein